MPSTRFIAKIYDKTGATFKGTIPSESMLDLPSITREVSKPSSDITLSLALPWDNFGYGTKINEFFLVKLYAVNENHPSGTLVYQGFITEIKSKFNSSTNHVELRLFPLESILGNAYWKSGSGQTLGDYTVGYVTADVDTMLSDAITNANTLHGTSYFTTSLGNPGKSINVNFVEQTHLQAIQRAIAFLDDTWFWRMTPSGQMQLAQFNDSTATHRFVVGSHVDEIEVTKTIMDVKNGVRVEYSGPAYSFYNDATSETAYGKRQEKLTDSSVLNLTSADALGNGNLAKKKDVKLQTVIRINAQYDLESISPGDTCTIVNVSDTESQMIAGVMRIVRVQYDGMTATLHLADILDNFGREFTLATA